MKINSRHLVRNGVALLSAFTMAATSALPASASSPDESTTTTQVDSPTTTLPAGPTTTLPDGSTTTVPAGSESAVKAQKNGPDLRVTSSTPDSPIPGFVFTAIVYVFNSGNESAGELVEINGVKYKAFKNAP